jgi:hypothetical protein
VERLGVRPGRRGREVVGGDRAQGLVRRGGHAVPDATTATATALAALLSPGRWAKAIEENVFHQKINKSKNKKVVRERREFSDGCSSVEDKILRPV